MLTRIASYTVSRPNDVSQIERRMRLLTSLVELPRKVRADFGKAVAEVCRDVCSQQHASEVTAGIDIDQGQSTLELQVAWNDASIAPTNAAVSRARELVEQVEVKEHQVRLRQLLGPAFRPPNENEIAVWNRMLQQRSFEDAFVTARQQGWLGAGNSDSAAFPSEDLSAQHSNRETRSFLELVAKHTDNFVAIMDHHGVITWINDAFSNLTGYSQGEVAGQKIDDLLGGPSTNQAMVRDLGQALRHGHPFAEELMFYRQDGRTFWAQFTLTPVEDESGKVSRWIVIGTDITRQHQAVEALSAAKKSAEESSRAKSEFLANMSHEIRTPLNAIIGMTELALTTQLTKEQLEYLSTVKLSAESLLELLNDVLDLSKIEAGKLTIEESEFNLADVIRDTVRALAVRAHSKGLELVSHMALDIPQWLRGDAVRLRQILVNLIGNAIKFTPKGEIEVDVERQWEGDGQVSLHFHVRDTGIGIPREKLEKIFEAFEQVDASMSRDYGGTGLGLTITAKLVCLMNGRIWVQSEVGRGSTFHVSLTFPVVDRPMPMAAAPDAASLSGRRVLIVDDNAANRRILEELVQHWGMRTTLVENGPAAVADLEAASAKDDPFDLVLLDAMMPGMDGYEVARLIRQHDDITCPAVMMLSSANRPDSARRCRELGIDVYLTKPVSPSTLLDSILTALGSLRSGDAEPSSAEESVYEPTTRPLRILIADDHEANRVLAARILSKRGHACVQCRDGYEALEQLQGNPFDVALMDVQMPGCDGFEATAHIREQEIQNGRHLPIVALTAHAMKGDREKCLAAGMDEYVAKPLRSRELVSVVERVAEGRTSSEENDVICFDAVLGRFDGDDEILAEQMRYFLHDGPQLMEQIMTAVHEGDSHRLQSSAHRLKGLLATYDRPAAAELARTLEFLGRDDDLDGAAEHLTALRGDVGRLVEAMRSYLSKSPS